jgi:hypothetical protein
LPPVEQAGPDLWSVPVPIPDSPLRYTLTYIAAAGSGLVVVDPGWDTEAGEVVAILGRRGPATVWPVTEELSWSRGWASVTGFMRRAAIAEAAAHLRHLADQGRISATAPAAAGPGRYGVPPPAKGT